MYSCCMVQKQMNTLKLCIHSVLAQLQVFCVMRVICAIFGGWNIDPWYFSMSDISRSAGAHHGLKLRLNALIGFFLPMAEGHKITHVLSFSPLQFLSTWKENLEKAKYSQTCVQVVIFSTWKENLEKGEMQSNPVFKWQLRNGAQVKIPRQCDLSGSDCNPDNSIREGGNWGGVALSSF